MKNPQLLTPLFDKLIDFSTRKPVSFHVPGHKNGQAFPINGKKVFQDILSIDVTELTGLDDLHAPGGVIADAQKLAASWFGVLQTYFLVGGSTVGNLAMILATCSSGEKVIVQRNCHKSILNGIELSGARPIFVAPDHNFIVDRYGAPSEELLTEAITLHPDAKAVILTYPDYFGNTSDISNVINFAHQHDIPVLVDEAHGVHFSIGHIFPKSSIDLGADIVVHSAHKMAPAMTMASYLHINSNRVKRERVEHYLQILQTSSPSYPLMASLDLARFYLATITSSQMDELLISIDRFRDVLGNSSFWKVLDYQSGVDDPLKVTIQLNNGWNGYDIAKLFERERLYPELATHNQILFVLGLSPINRWEEIQVGIQNINEQLKIMTKHATIEGKVDYFPWKITSIKFTYNEMKKKSTTFVTWDDVNQHIAAEAIIPYPPGIPIIAKGEQVTENHVQTIKKLLQQGTNFQNKLVKDGLHVFIQKES
ncbi:aminotransferase class I/II-fold pyridoxal phosphate-dependent enzyme [Aquibacillus koreensis]|uniref:Aminotransferase class I/II-fold pyridoxal phosphate-dependent enzyme n=1 Tax=Aquibacillus koreensis TaxID=279446 RepID=A0A9X3WP02_9BACI|nr:aminotransferase class I/II-fold pyridoxal phosphate-dependent enzyme [Aquibacillus koreensis]MCT2534284.1 aminotransferase class I/II-fold pyridoxal phosphate-dependent enzyme [Aquibacillus koreensis]MDC3422415.1 aminotransferase class I/II-fold pyridoxal phosphate-dependent enzyme [Aquibacillus koreensis]